MPRRPRLNLAGLPLHVVQRGNNRQPCFYAEEDYRFYLHWLAAGADKHGCAIHAYVLMMSSYRCHAPGEANPLLRDHQVYVALDGKVADGQRAYRALFRSELDAQAISEIRKSANRSIPLGGERFREAMEYE